MGWLGDVGGFFEGTAQGAWDGIKGTVQGVGHLAQDGYKLAIDGEYRKQAWDDAVKDAKAVGNFAETAVTHPRKAADEIGDAASNAWHSVQTAYDQAASQSQGGEFVGKLFGQGAILVGTAFIPGGGEADAVSALGDAGRTGELLGDAGKAVDTAKIADTAGAALRTEVRNGYTYTLDETGRTTHVEGELVSNPAQGRNAAAQLEAGGADRLPTDEGGHFVARRFDGPLEAFNHFAQDMNLNRGAYKSLENTWQRALDRGGPRSMSRSPPTIPEIR